MSSLAGNSARWLPLLLGAVVLAVFSPVIDYDFAPLDDDVNVLYNPHHGPPTSARWQWALSDTTYIRRYQPLGWMAFAGVSTFSGLRPWGYHVAAIGLHALNAVLLGLLLQSLLRRLRPGEKSGHGPAALAPWLAAAWWALHPLRVEPVAWISAIPTHLALAFLLAALLLHLRARPAIAPLLGGVAFAAGLLSYPVALGAAAFFPLMDWAGGHRGRRLILRALPYAAVALAIGWINLAARAGAGSEHAPMATLQELPASIRALRGFCFIVHYAWKPWFPFGLGPVYGELLDITWSSPPVLGSAGLAAVVIAAVWRRPALAPLPLAGIAVLLPITGVTELIHFPHDRYALWSDLILAAGLAILISRIATPRTQAMAGLLLAGLTVLTLHQLPVWRSSESVMERLRHNLPAGKATVIRDIRPALWLFRDGHFDGAEALLNGELRERPDDPAIQSGLETLKALRTEHEAIVRETGLTPGQIPPSALLHHRLAVQLLRNGDPEPAAWHLAEIARLAPDYFSRLNRTEATPATTSPYSR